MKIYFLNRCTLCNERGSMLLYVGLMLAFIATMGMSLVSTATEDDENTSNSVYLAQAEYESTAAMEWANYWHHRGYDPSVSEKQLGGGNFTVAFDSTTGVTGTAGTAGPARVNHGLKLGLPSISCSGELAFESVNDTTGKLKGVTIQKIDDLDTVIIDKLTLSWTKSTTDQIIDAVSVGDDGSSANLYERRVGYSPQVGTPEQNVVSGQEIDIENVYISDAIPHEFTYFSISYPAPIRLSTETISYAPAVPDTFTLTFTFNDGNQTSCSLPLSEIDPEDSEEDDGPGLIFTDKVFDDGPTGGIVDPQPDDIIIIPGPTTTVTTVVPDDNGSGEGTGVTGVDPDNFDIIDVVNNNIQTTIDTGITVAPDLEHGAFNNGFTVQTNEFTQGSGPGDDGTIDVGTSGSWFGTGTNTDTTNMTNYNADTMQSGASVQNMQNMFNYNY